MFRGSHKKKKLRGKHKDTFVLSQGEKGFSQPKCDKEIPNKENL